MEVVPLQRGVSPVITCRQTMFSQGDEQAPPVLPKESEIEVYFEGTSWLPNSNCAHIA